MVRAFSLVAATAAAATPSVIDSGCDADFDIPRFAPDTQRIIWCEFVDQQGNVRFGQVLEFLAKGGARRRRRCCGRSFLLMIRTVWAATQLQ
jgi:hypothetical protein